MTINGKWHDVADGTISTSGASTATCLTYVIPSDVSGDFMASVEANISLHDASGNTAILRKIVCVKRISGTVSIPGVGVGLALTGDSALALCSATADINSSNIRILVTGVSLLTIEWQTTLLIDIDSYS